MNQTVRKKPDSDRPVQLIHLADLDLDTENPRFGGLRSSASSQREILDHIVENFGISDVLASLSVNGYFPAEPLVGRQIQGTNRYVIIEGNRRLAACLILSGDERASNQEKLATPARETWKNHERPKIDPIPVICFGPQEDTRELLSYLGVRHISASAPWDSYAKAAWISEVISKAGITVAEVAQMVGDKHKTVSRLVEGFYFMKQVEASGEFRSSDSVRSGRGSVTSYPFSWVYTILGYQTIRRFLNLGDAEPMQDPVPADKLKEAGLVCVAMFGNKSKGQNSAIQDSRSLGDLASVFASAEKIALLEAGKSISEISRITRPIDERLRRGLLDVKILQQEILGGLAEQPLPREIAEEHLPAARANRSSAQAVEKQLYEAVMPSSD